MPPLVSVLVPTHQRAATIARAVDAALAQTVDDLEVIVSDNASTDGTDEVLNAYADDPRVVVLRNERNEGPVPNWRRALEAASGKWIKVNWSDDWMDAAVVEELLASVEEGASFAIAPQRLHLHDAQRDVGSGATGTVTLEHLLDLRNLGRRLPVSPGAGLVLRHDAEWALGPGTASLPSRCTGSAIGPDLLLLYAALRRGEEGRHTGGTALVHFDGRHDSISERSGAARLGRCYAAAVRHVCQSALTNGVRAPAWPRARLTATAVARAWSR